MTAIAIPDVLNRIAQAGAAGIPMNNPSAADDLELCKEWGYRFETKTGRICLPFNQGSLTPYWIKSETSAASWAKLTVIGFFEIGSTNDEALARARAGAPEGLLVFSEMQSSGRGRVGRRWVSSPCAGLCFSLVLRPSCQQKYWPLLTHAVSVALSETLKDLWAHELVERKLSIDLKWPNDVLLSGKKVAGILLETAGSEAAVVGIGINVSHGSVPEDLKEQATSIGDEADGFIPRRWLLVRFLENLRNWYDRFEQGEFAAILDQWKKSSSMWDKTPIWVSEGGVRRAAVTCGLSEMGELKIMTEQGEQEILLAGDVSVRRSFEAGKGQ
jgi:BirA family transcriptional regulator, biotin operon repressor / biotin---[acetyl-CoA-carboxylase] ligase